MYRVEFIKQNLNGKGSVIDEEVGEVLKLPQYDSESDKLTGYKIKGILYSTGTEFDNKVDAESAASQYRKIFTPFPERYKVTTEVYRICE